MALAGPAIGLMTTEGDACIPSRDVFVEFISPGLLLDPLKELFEGHYSRLPELNVVLDLANKHLIEGDISDGL